MNSILIIHGLRTRVGHSAIAYVALAKRGPQVKVVRSVARPELLVRRYRSRQILEPGAFNGKA